MIIIDLNALINTIVHDIPGTYRELVKILVERIPNNYKQVDIIADDYQNKANSLKLNE